MKKVSKITYCARPKPSREIIDAINADNLVIFVGAGASAQCGLPLWDDLASKLLNSCATEGYIDRGQLDLYNKRIEDTRQKITIAYEIYKDNKNENGFYNELKRKLSVNNEKKEKVNQIYKFCQISHALVLTTNADIIIDKYFEKEFVYYDLKKIELWRTFGPALIKIHGSIKCNTSLVFTMRQYLERYNNASFKDFLINIFSSNKTILFIGYSFKDFELLEYIIKPFNKNDKNSIFVINGYYDYEEKLCNCLDLYYDSLGIKQISFSKDKNDYDELNTIINEWIDIIENNTSLKKNDILKLNQAINKKDISLISQLTRNSIDNANYLFSELRKRKDAQYWVSVLIDTELFKPKNYLLGLVDVKFENEKNVTKFIVWPALKYLYDISYCNSAPNQFILDSKIISLIQRSVKCIIQYGKNASNYKNVMLIYGLLAKFRENILGKQLLKFLSVANDPIDMTIGYFLWCLGKEKNDLSNYKNEEIIMFLRVVFNKLNDNNSFYKESLKRFLNIYSVSSNSIVNEKIANMLCDYILRKEKENVYAFGYIGAVSLPIDNTYNRASIIILNYLKSIINESVSTCRWLINFTKGVQQNSLLQKLCIFGISTNFNELKKILFDSKINPFDNFNTYSDLYYLIKTNASRITKKEFAIIYNWIDNSYFGQNIEHIEYIKVLKYDLLNLIFDGLNCNMKITGLVKPINYNNYLSVDNRNKVFIEKDYVSKKESIMKDISNKSFSDLCAYFKNIAFDARSVDEYKEVFRQTIKQYDLTKYRTISICKKLPVYLYPVLAESIIDKCKKENMGFYIDLCIDLLNYYINKSYDISTISTFIFSLDKILSVTNYEKKYMNRVCKTILNVLVETKTLYYKTYKFNNNLDILNQIFNDWFCYAISVLLKLVRLNTANNITIRKRTVDLLNDILNNTNGIVLPRITISYCLNNIYCFAKEWAINNLDSIISDYKGIIASVSGGAYFPELYSRITKINELNKIYVYATDHDSNIICLLSRISIYYSVKNDKNIDKYLMDILDISGTTTLASIFEQLFIMLYGKNLAASYQCIIDMSNYVVKNHIQVIDDSDEAMKNICKCILKIRNKKCIDAHVWECIKYLAQYIKYYIADEITQCFLEYYDMYPKEIATIICIMIENLDDGISEFAESLLRIIKKISNNRNLKDCFNSINSSLISRGIWLE